MHIDNAILEKLERLSHLRVDDTKKADIIGQLSEIVSYVENLSELDTDHLDASFSTLKGGTPMREDNPISDPSVATEILNRAPQHAEDFFVVPAIIE